MEKKFDVLVVGELNMDLILSGIGELPQKGKEILAKEMSLTLGSSSAIFASNLSTLGSSVCFVGKIGKDQFGRQAMKSLSEKGVDVSKILYSNTAKTGITVACSYENERAMITHPGSMTELTEDEISDEVIRSCRHLHVSSIFLQPNLKRGIIPLFQRAKQAGLTTSLDTQWDPDEKWECDWENLLPLVNVFLPNLEEIKGITKQDNAKACINKIKGFSNIIVVKKGLSGSVAWDGEDFLEQPAFINRQVKDTIGAGDSFNAGFIYRFINDKILKECLESGSLCGAINTTAFGGTTAFGNKEEIKQTALNPFNYHLDDL